MAWAQKILSCLLSGSHGGALCQSFHPDRKFLPHFVWSRILVPIIRSAAAFRSGWHVRLAVSEEKDAKDWVKSALASFQCHLSSLEWAGAHHQGDQSVLALAWTHIKGIYMFVSSIFCVNTKLIWAQDSSLSWSAQHNGGEGKSRWRSEIETFRIVSPLANLLLIASLSPFSQGRRMTTERKWDDEIVNCRKPTIALARVTWGGGRRRYLESPLMTAMWRWRRSWRKRKEGRKPGPLWIVEATAAAPTTRRQLDENLLRFPDSLLSCPLLAPAWVSGASTRVIENCLLIPTF